MPRAPRSEVRAVVLFELDFGDAEVIVREHSDGLFTVDLDDHRLLVNADQMQMLVGAFGKIGRDKGWT